MRGTGWKAENQGNHIPTNGAQKSGKEDLLVDHLDVHEPLADGFGDSGAKDESRDEVPKCGPHNGAERCQNSGRNNSCDRIRRIMPAVGKLENESQNNNSKEEVEGTHGLGALQYDAFDDVGDIFTLIDRSLYNFENLFPLNDLNGIFFLVEQLGYECAAETVALILKAIDFDAVLQSFIAGLDGMNYGSNFGASREKDIGKVCGTWADLVHAVKNEATGGGVDQIDDVV